MSQRYAIDSIALQDSVVFGWGWFLDEQLPARSCYLEVPLQAGGAQRLSCVSAGMRDDLKSAFPHIGHAASAGFIIRGRLAGPVDESVPARLVCTLADGRVQVKKLHGFPSRYIRGREPKGRARWRQFRKRLDVLGAGPALAAEAEREFDTFSRWCKRRRLEWILFRTRDVVVVFDHAMGGGANRYCRDLVDSLLSQSRTVALVTFRLASLNYCLTVMRDGESVEVAHSRLGGLLRQLSFGAVTEIHINNLVSFVDPLGVVRWARRKARAGGARIYVHLHDFYAVCPSWTLIDAWDKFCGVPPLTVCRECLPANKAHTLSLAPDMGVAEWRAEWRELLQSSNAIVAFSQASVEILTRAYPDLGTERILVRPHAVDAEGLRRVSPTFGEDLVIGVIGHISAAKGARMLKEMAGRIRDEGMRIRIVVFGTLEHHHVGDGIQVTGEYDRRHLPELLEQHQVGVCMLPSVCAETFSYVTAEIMAMGMPLAVFALGAPAERVADYDRGLVISRIDASTALQEIQAFVDDLRRQGSS
jgi:glycosyltransferase involved in cell wall biosynthesis